MSGSYPDPDVVTRSGVGFTPRACQYFTSSFVYLTNSADLGPKFVAPDSPPTPLRTKVVGTTLKDAAAVRVTRALGEVPGLANQRRAIGRQRAVRLGLKERLG